MCLGCAPAPVSIPRSGFWVFKRPLSRLRRRPGRSFNPSVGILGVQACASSYQTQRKWQFQSLGRDSGCSSRQHPQRQTRQPRVSIPRSGFWVFKQKRQQLDIAKLRKFQSLGRDSGCSSGSHGDNLVLWPTVSIPRSGFWVFKHHVQRGKAPSSSVFQSLGRDSGCSSRLPHWRQGGR